MQKAPQRLKRRREFLKVARSGRKWAAPGLVLQVLDRDAVTNTTESPGIGATRSKAEPVEKDSIRVGFTVSRRVGGAVTRNRARRRLRAAVETVMPTHAAKGKDYVVIGRAGTIGRRFPDLVADLETALRKLKAWNEMGAGPENSGHDEERRKG